MSIEQAISWLIMASVVVYLFDGWRLVRVIAWLGLWQAFTPIRPWYIDLPLLIACLLITEVMFYQLKNNVLAKRGG